MHISRVAVDLPSMIRYAAVQSTHLLMASRVSEFLRTICIRYEGIRVVLQHDIMIWNNSITDVKKRVAQDAKSLGGHGCR